MKRDTTRLDAAVLAFRKNPTPENREALLEEQRAYTAGFFQRLAADYIEQTRRGR